MVCREHAQTRERAAMLRRLETADPLWVQAAETLHRKRCLARAFQRWARVAASRRVQRDCATQHSVRAGKVGCRLPTPPKVHPTVACRKLLLCRKYHFISSGKKGNFKYTQGKMENTPSLRC